MTDAPPAGNLLPLHVLYYIGDPMCSWCWGFAPVLEALEKHMGAAGTMRYVMGGLAPDSDEPMSEETRQYVRENWRAVADATSAEFNWDFWEKCQPRRSTYPACRAVLAADEQGDSGMVMYRAIQVAYYRQARNPSDATTLIELAGEIDLDTARFTEDLHSAATESRLHEDFALRRELGVSHFPSLVLETSASRTVISRGYSDSESVLGVLHPLIRG